MRALLLLILLLALCLPGLAADSHLDWWQDARFGMFIHWGIYSVLGHGEWAMNVEKIPVETYERLAPRFHPDRFNADEWASLAKAAGQKYVVLTSKHHDGFCMFDSEFTDYDAGKYCGRDFVKELNEACRRQGLKFGVYYSILDWHHPLYKSDFDRYAREYMIPQLRELCTRYGRLDVLWFDGGWEHTPEEIHSEEVLAMLRELQPGIVINDRSNLPADFGTPEQTIPDWSVAKSERPWETCMTINGSWGYNSGDMGYKSAIDLTRKLVDIVSKGGNFLLNVGPLPTGEIPLEQRTRLRQMGAWLAKNGKSVYGTGPTPLIPPPAGVAGCTNRGRTLYLHLFDWPAEGRIELSRLLTPVKKAWLLGSGLPVVVEGLPGLQQLVLPEVAPDLIDTVVVVELAGAPVVDNSLRADEQGIFHLAANQATIHGGKLRYQSEHGDLGYWVDPADYPEWEMLVQTEGRYKVTVLVGAPDGEAGSTFKVEVGSQSLAGTVPATGDWYKYAELPLGEVNLLAGTLHLTLKPTKLANFAVMNLKEIRLEPVFGP